MKKLIGHPLAFHVVAIALLVGLLAYHSHNTKTEENTMKTQVEITRNINNGLTNVERGERGYIDGYTKQNSSTCAVVVLYKTKYKAARLEVVEVKELTIIEPNP